uniref:C2 NT-type domain-containing protein n=1 Tax=Kalanchoe fedtschenkoi TaxID=63787 RepID=A0A7N0VHL7_KALFE
MFKSARWRIDRNSNRIKSVFRLHFRVTQVPVLVGDALLVSVIPKDVGKPTTRLEKAAVKDGNCCWENPVYETVRFLRDPKSGKLNETVYYFLVSTGNQKSNVVGEVLIDFSEYAESIKPSHVSLPFKNSLCAAVLHVTIQRMQEHAEVRGAIQCEDVNVKLDENCQKTRLGDVEFDEKTISNSLLDTPLPRTASENVEWNGNQRVSSGSDLLSSSECSSELNTPRELALSIHQGHTTLKSSPSCDSLTRKQTTTTFSLPNQELQQQLWEWSVGFDGLSAADSTINSLDNLQKQRSLSSADVEIEKLKTELLSLARQAEFSGLELQTLRKQIVKESKRGNELTRELINLTEERDALKAECANLKAAQKRLDEAKVKNRGVRDPLVLIEELRQELQYEKDLNANLKVQLQKTQDSNTELILAVQDLDEMLERKNEDTPDMPNKEPSYENAVEAPKSTCKYYIQEDNDQKALEDMVNRHDDVEDASLFEQKGIDLYHELDLCRRERDEMEMQMDQLALDYEILTQENHDLAYKLEQSQLQEQLKMQYECSYTSINELESQIEGLENELRKQEKKYSDSSTKISDLQAEVIFLEEELEKQAQEFEADLEAVTRAKIEQEQRAILAENSLRATKYKNANTAERLHEDFKRLSLQMASTFDANEKLAMKSINEAAELRLERNRLEILLRKATEELLSVKKDYEAKLDGVSNEAKLSMHRINEMIMEVEDKTIRLEAQDARKREMPRDLSQEMLRLIAEIQRLTEANDIISKERDLLKAELEKANLSTDEAEMLLIGRNVELSELEDEIALISEKADKSAEELAITRSVLKEKEAVLENLVLELEHLKAHHGILKQTYLEDESENIQFRNQVLQPKRDIKKEDTLSTNVKNLKEMNGSETSGNNIIICEAHLEAAYLTEKIRQLEGQTKLNGISIETKTNSFLEKEKDLMDKIKELESRAEEPSQNSCLSDFQYQKVGRDALNIGKVYQVEWVEQGTRKATSNSSCDGTKLSVSTSDQSNPNAMMSEMEKLKERNLSMEIELKELQGRYSEISLKFAEVEGERQKLVMSLRCLKNSRKN